MAGRRCGAQARHCLTWMSVRDRLRRLRRASATTVVVTVGPGQERFLADCLDRLGETPALIAPWGAAAVPTATDVLPPAVTANDARNAAAVRVTSGCVLFLETTDVVVRAALGPLQDALAGNRSLAVVRAGAQPHRLGSYLWRAGAVPTFDPAAGRFPQGSLPVGQPVPGRALLAPADNSWGVPFGTTPQAAAEIPTFLRALDGARDAPWLPSYVAAALPAFLDDLDHATDVDHAALARVLASYGPRELGGLDPETRLRAWLVGAGRAEDAAVLHAARWRTDGQAPTRLEADRLSMVLPVPADVDLPPWVLAIEPSLECHLHRVEVDGSTLRATVFAGIRWLDLAGRAPVVTARIVHDSGASVDVAVEPRPDREATRTFEQGHQNHDAGAVVVSLDTAALGREGTWRLLVRMVVDGLDLEAPVDRREARGSAGIDWPVGRAMTSFDGRGFALRVGATSAAPSPRRVAATAVELSDVLTVTGTGHPDALELACAEWRIPATLTLDATGFTATFPLEHDPWGLGPRALPTGTHHVVCHAGDTFDLPIARELIARSPVDVRTDRFRARFTRGLRDQLLVMLRPPLADDEAGRWAQHQLRERYRADDRPVDPGLVLLESYAGSGATDSPRVILDEMRRRRPDLRYLWTIADRSVIPPEGTTPVLMRSRAWYDAIAAAGTIVSNVEMEWFFRRRPGQTLMLTFHGYPSKSMGLELWRSKNHPPRRMEQMLLQTSGQWSVGLTPAPEMDRLYREQFRYDGPLLNRGYPRDDVLVGPDADRIRAEARARLGIGEGQVAVLYAPTWRDDLATNFRSAAMPTHLDVEAASEALGDDHVLLLRGHRFNTPPGTRGRAQVRDVTSYPEINDLILAADVAVLDYSSLRFDWVLTGKPVIFLVPDLERYAGVGRGFLFPFTESAPGPLVATTGEVVRWVQERDRLRGDYADEIAAFNVRFNVHQDGHAAERVVDWLEARDNLPG